MVAAGVPKTTGGGLPDGDGAPVGVGWNVAAGRFSRSDVADERIAVVVGHSDIADQHVRSEAVECAQRSTH